MSRTPSEYLDSDSPLGSPEPHDPWGQDAGGAVLWIALAGIAVCAGIWWVLR